MNLVITHEFSKQMFVDALAGYRAANTALDAAIANECWGEINEAQQSRTRHAEVIALIINKESTAEGGLPA